MHTFNGFSHRSEFIKVVCPVNIFQLRAGKKHKENFIVKESCNSSSLGANMAEAESSTDQRMFKGGGREGV